MAERQCWRLLQWDDVSASLERPLIFSARRGGVVAEYRPYAEGWYPPRGSPTSPI